MYTTWICYEHIKHFLKNYKTFYKQKVHVKVLKITNFQQVRMINLFYMLNSSLWMVTICHNSTKVQTRFNSVFNAQSFCWSFHIYFPLSLQSFRADIMDSRTSCWCLLSSATKFINKAVCWSSGTQKLDNQLSSSSSMTSTCYTLHGRRKFDRFHFNILSLRWRRMLLEFFCVVILFFHVVLLGGELTDMLVAFYSTSNNARMKEFPAWKEYDVKRYPGRCFCVQVLYFDCTRFLFILIMNGSCRNLLPLYALGRI